MARIRSAKLLLWELGKYRILKEISHWLFVTITINHYNHEVEIGGCCFSKVTGSNFSEEMVYRRRL